MRKLGIGLFVALSLWLQVSPAFADELVPPDFMSNDDKFFSPMLRRHPLKRRSFVWPQLTSLLLPGFDQWWEGQYGSAVFYTTVGVSGQVLAVTAGRQDPSGNDVFDSRNNSARQAVLGSQMNLDAGFLSAYHSFRSAVRSQQANGRFLFLQHEETTDQLFESPFAFSEIIKPTTFIPLAGILALGVVEVSGQGGRPHFNLADGFYSGAYSYGAGVSEEAFFRGYFLPVTYYYFDNYFWSNTATALVFAAAHISSGIDFPLPQFALGWYLGYLTQHRGWTLQQSIFIHTWWDVISFAATYYENSRSRVGPAHPAGVAPLINATF